MVRARLWPATPQRPHLVFTFELLDWTEAMLLECQVSLMDFCKALCFKCPHIVVKVRFSVDHTFVGYKYALLEKGLLFLYD